MLLRNESPTRIFPIATSDRAINLEARDAALLRQKTASSFLHGILALQSVQAVNLLIANSNHQVPWYLHKLDKSMFKEYVLGRLIELGCRLCNIWHVHS